MNECTETDKPLISIVMAVYEPNLQWFREQLDSLEAQTYPNLELLVLDDCSPTVPLETVRRYVAQSIRSFPYQVARNEKNLGSNGTFEKLTQQARGKYIAYCDQDDVWLPEKLEILQRTIEQTSAKLVCSDMYIIDGKGKQTAGSIQKVRKHHVFQSGEGLAKELLFHNFVTGCTMLVHCDDAKAAVPFCPYMVHDHYLALWCGEKGRIESLEQPTIQYRIHGGNQTGVMAGVQDKESYGIVRIDSMAHRLQWLDQYFPCGAETKLCIQEGIKWSCARQKNWKNGNEKSVIWKYRHFSTLPSVFEICFRNMPEKMFQFIITLARRNWF